MRLSTLSLVLAPLLLLACAETPRCVDRGTPERPRILVECNAGKVPVCGNDPAQLYDEASGALLPVPPDTVESGSCEGLGEDCRTRPVCGEAGGAVTCADGQAPVCVLGAVTTVRITTPMPDSGPPDEDAGAPIDAGSDASAAEDGGSDAGTDAGSDAG